jgi:hypothetical protein
MGEELSEVEAEKPAHLQVSEKRQARILSLEEAGQIAEASAEGMRNLPKDHQVKY